MSHSHGSQGGFHQNHRGGFRGGRGGGRGRGGARTDTRPKNEERPDHSPLGGIVGTLARLGDIYLISPSQAPTPENPHSLTINVPISTDTPALARCCQADISVSDQVRAVADYIATFLPREASAVLSGMLACVMALPSKPYIYASLAANIAQRVPTFSADIARELSSAIEAQLRALFVAVTGVPHAASMARSASKMCGDATNPSALALAALQELDRCAAPARPLSVHRALGQLLRFLASLCGLRVLPVDAFAEAALSLLTVAGISAATKTADADASDAAQRPAVPLWRGLPYAHPVPLAPAQALTVTEVQLPPTASLLVTPLADSIAFSILAALPFLLSDALPHYLPIFARTHAALLMPSEENTASVDFDWPVEDDDEVWRAEAELAGVPLDQVLVQRQRTLVALVASIETYLCQRDAALALDALIDAPANTYKDGYGCLAACGERDDLTALFAALTGHKHSERSFNAALAADAAITAAGEGAEAMETPFSSLFVRATAIPAPGVLARRQLQRAMIAATAIPRLSLVDLPTPHARAYMLVPAYGCALTPRAAPLFALPSLPAHSVVFLSAPLQTAPLLPPLARPIPASPLDLWLLSDFALLSLSTMDGLREQQMLALLTLPPATPQYGRTQAPMLLDSVRRAVEDGAQPEQAQWQRMCPSLSSARSRAEQPHKHTLGIVIAAIARAMLAISPQRAPHTDILPIASTSAVLHDLTLPSPALLVKLLSDLVTAFPQLIPPLIGPRFNVLFRHVHMLRVPARTAFAKVLASYLVGNGMQWPWVHWANVLPPAALQADAQTFTPIPSSAPVAFLSDLFAHAATLLPVDVILGILGTLGDIFPPAMGVLLPARTGLHDRLAVHRHAPSTDTAQSQADCALCPLQQSVSALTEQVRLQRSSAEVLLFLRDHSAQLTRTDVRLAALQLSPTFAGAVLGDAAPSAAELQPVPVSTPVAEASGVFLAAFEPCARANEVHPLLLPLWLAVLRRSRTHTHIHALMQRYGPVLALLANAVGAGRGWVGCNGAAADEQSLAADMAVEAGVPLVCSADNNARTGFVRTSDGACAVPCPAHVALLDLAASAFRTDRDSLAVCVAALLRASVVSAASALYWACHGAPRAGVVSAVSTSGSGWRVAEETVTALAMSLGNACERALAHVRAHPTPATVANVAASLEQAKTTLARAVLAVDCMGAALAADVSQLCALAENAVSVEDALDSVQEGVRGVLMRAGAASVGALGGDSSAFALMLLQY